VSESVIRIRGDVQRAAEGVLTDAVADLAAGAPQLRKKYFGVKDYDRFRGQREDHTYGWRPRHGHIVFAVELDNEIRARLRNGGNLTEAEIQQGVSFLENHAALQLDQELRVLQGEKRRLQATTKRDQARLNEITDRLASIKEVLGATKDGSERKSA
jgi:hypothetical protein